MPIATYVMVTEPLGPRLDEVLRARATLYGAMAGCREAEGFMLMRDIDLMAGR